MIKTSLFYSKVMIKQPLFILALIFSVFITIQFKGVINLSLFLFIKIYFYAFICSNLYILLFSTLTASKNTEVILFLEKDRVKNYITLIISAMSIACITAVTPIISILLFKNELLEFGYVLRAVVHFLILWFTTNLMSATIGTSVGLLIKNKFAVLLSFLIYIVFIKICLEAIDGQLLKTLNIFDDYLFSETNELTGTLFNLSYFIDKVFSLLLILLIILIVSAVLTNKGKSRFIAASILTVSLMVGSYMVSQHYYQVIPERYEIVGEQEEIKKIEPFTIHTYKMDVVLKKTLKNKVLLEMSVLEDTTAINFLLDDIFKIKSVSVGGKTVDFIHENGEVMITSAHKKDDYIQLSIEYNGFVHMRDNIGKDTYYVNYAAINLPGGAFHWYPTIQQQQPIQFDVSIDTKLNIHSNLLQKEEENGLLSGTATAVNLFAGPYQTISEDGIEYIMPVNYNLEIFKQGIAKIINGESSLTEEERNRLENKQYNKVLVGVWDYGMGYDSIELMEDTLLIMLN